ncbi:MAG: HdeD family acid-resistance protein [Verrucomicrobiota bacterium]
MKKQEQAVAAVIQEHKGWFKFAGIVLLVLGFFSVLLPLVATLVYETLFGVLFLIGGLAMVLQAFQCRGWRGFLLQMIVGVLNVGVGSLLLLFPVKGALVLTAVLAAFFLIQGAFRMILALQVRQTKGWGWMWVSGLATLLLGIVIYGALPVSAGWAIGLLVGIDFIFAGFALLAVGSAKDEPSEPGEAPVDEPA